MRISFWRWSMAGVAVLAMAGAVSTSHAANRHVARYRNENINNSRNQPANNTPAPAPAPAPAPTPPPVTSPEQEAARQASKNYTDLVARLTDGFEKSPEAVAARQAIADASKAAEAARSAVVASLSEDPKYKAAKEAEAASKARLDKLRDTSDTSGDAFHAAVDEHMQLLSAVGQIEHDAVLTDPSAHEKTTAVETARSQLAKLRADFQKSLQSNPEVIAAKKAVDDAQAKVVASKAKAGH